MIKNGKGGKKTKTGNKSEKNVQVCIRKSLINEDYNLTLKRGPTKSDNDKFINITGGGKSIAQLFKRSEFIYYLKNNGINPKELVSKVEIPDYAVVKDNICYIIEVKYQNCSGSVDEKLETSPFKIQQFKKMVKSLNLEIKYIYVLNDWFKRPQYKDVLEYIEDNDGKYIFNDLKASDVGF